MRGLSLLILLQGAAAFPSALKSVLEKAPMEKRVSSGCTVSATCNKYIDIPDSMVRVTSPAAEQFSASRGNCGTLAPCLVFSATEQYVSNTGAHAYASPAADEIRGPCPGLNAASNHAYLPRSGIATIIEAVDGLGELYGMAPDLSGFLAAYAIVIDGDIVSQTWSIGGPLPQATLGSGLLSKPQGISWSHNKYEGDTSIARCDAYTNGGDAHSLSTTRFRYAYESGMDNDRYTIDKYGKEFTKNTFRSIQNNPLYFAGAVFSTTLVAPAAYNLVINHMSNHTAAEPNGYLDGAMFKTWFGVTGDYPNFKWLPGQDRIPDNWYRRTSTNQYPIAGVFADLLPSFAAYPDSFRFGGNTNGVNTYKSVDVEEFSGGAYTLENLKTGNNFACFNYQLLQQVIPDELQFLVADVAKSMAFLEKYMGFFSALDCPAVSKFNNNDLSSYPGKTYSPTGPATNC